MKKSMILLEVVIYIITGIGLFFAAFYVIDIAFNYGIGSAIIPFIFYVMTVVILLYAKE